MLAAPLAGIRNRWPVLGLHQPAMGGGQQWAVLPTIMKGSRNTMNYLDEAMIDEVDFGADLGGGLSPFHQICPQEGQTIRVAMLDEFLKPLASHYHWYRGGFYRCNSRKGVPEAPCCEVRRSWTCVCLAVQYLNADASGKLKRGADIKFRVGYVSLARTAFGEVSEWVTGAPGCDLLYTKSGGSYSFQGESRNPFWKLSPQAGQVEAEAKRWAGGEKLREKLGRKLTDEEWARLLKTGSPYEIEED